MLPDIVIGVDIETRALNSDAYILSIGATAIDVRTLEPLTYTYHAFKPNDPKYLDKFSINAGTDAWWKGAGDDEDSPSVEAKKYTWGGTEDLFEGLKSLINDLEIYRNRNYVMTARGPEFDMPIILNAIYATGIRFPGLFRKFSLFDSDRTAVRMHETLGFEMNYDTELSRIRHDVIKCMGCSDDHTALYDSAKEAYQTARAYHLMSIIKSSGYNIAIKRSEELNKGKI